MGKVLSPFFKGFEQQLPGIGNFHLLNPRPLALTLLEMIF
jgi:hypothetical protein